MFPGPKICDLDNPLKMNNTSVQLCLKMFKCLTTEVNLFGCSDTNTTKNTNGE